VAAITLGLGSPAFASDGKGIDAAKTAVTNRINLRLTALQKDTTQLGAAKNLTAEHRTSLQGLITQDTSGLTALKGTVAGETTLDGVKNDATSMVQDYRIFMLVGPKVRLTSAGDTEQAVLTKLRSVHDTLAGLLAKVSGTDTTAAQADLAAMAAALDQAAGHLNGQVAAVLAIAPGPDAAGIQAKVTAVRTALAAGRANLRTAADDAKKVRDFLKGISTK
jgi:hypothetical protein